MAPPPNIKRNDNTYAFELGIVVVAILVMIFFW
jgi:hypothetical protein